jgi:hypothetical protein
MNTMMRGSPAVLMYELPLRLLNVTPGLLMLLGVTSAATAVLYARSGHHTTQSHPDHPPGVFHDLPRSSLAYVGTRNSDRGIYLLGLSTLAGDTLLLAIKFVPGTRPANKTGADQCFASTLYYARQKEVNRLLGNGALRPVTRVERDAVGEMHAG